MRMDVLRNREILVYQRYLQPCSSTTIIEQGHVELNYSNTPLRFADPLSLCHSFHLFTPELVISSDVSRCRVRNTGQMKTRWANSRHSVYIRRTYTGIEILDEKVNAPLSIMVYSLNSKSVAKELVLYTQELLYSPPLGLSITTS